VLGLQQKVQTSAFECRKISALGGQPPWPADCVCIFMDSP